jgi:hypothetical protein
MANKSPIPDGDCGTGVNEPGSGGSGGDDGRCLSYDGDGTGSVDVQDLLGLLAQFGCDCDNCGNGR